METELWFNKAGNTGVPHADPDVVTAGPTRDVATNNSGLRTESIICNKCSNGAPVSNMFDVEWRTDGEYICPEGWTSDNFPCKEDEFAGCMDTSAENYNRFAVVDDGSCSYPSVDDVNTDTSGGGPIDAPIIYSNICYSCLDGNVKAEVIESDLENVCPDGFSVLNVDVCPKEKKDNKDLILYLAIGVSAYLLLSK